MKYKHRLVNIIFSILLCFVQIGNVYADESLVEITEDDLSVGEAQGLLDAGISEDMTDSCVTILKDSGLDEHAYKAADIVYRKSGMKSISKPSQKKIVEAYKKYTADNEKLGENGVYSKQPNVLSFDAGELSSAYVNNAGDNLNFIRMLAGLSGVDVNASLNESAQYGALVSAANKKIAHSPKKPDGMSDNIFKLCNDACAWSNLYSRTPEGKNKQFRYAFVSYMCDNNSASNLAGMGHRRWILNPHLVRTGFGQAAYPKDENTTSAFGAAVMRVTKGEFDKVDPEKSDCGDYDFISWPSSGNFPVDEGSFNYAAPTIPWSITLNPAKYAAPAAANVKITITRETDKKSWRFDASDVRTPASKNDKYMLINTKGYGVNNAIIFNLGSAYSESSLLRDSVSHLNGDAAEMRYSVQVSGIKTTAGAETTLNYRINFFDINSPDTKSEYYNSAEGLEDSGSDDVNPSGDEKPTQDVIVEENKVFHTVRFDGAHPDSQKVEHGGFISPLPNYDDEIPEGMYFASWYLKNADGTFKALMTETTPIISDMHLYPYFLEDTDGRDSITGAFITVKNQNYTGYALTPDIQVKLGKLLLEECTDYSVTYLNNTDAGTASVRIKGIGRYMGEKTATFNIIPRQLKLADIWFEPLTGFETGTLSESALIKRLRGHYVDDARNLIENEDFSIALSTSKLKIVNGVGTMGVVVTGRGNYTGVVKTSFNCYSDVNAPLLSEYISASVIATDDAAYDSDKKCFVYTGKAIKPAVNIPGLSAKDYAVKFKNNKEAGKARVMIAGKGAYKGQKYTLYFTIAKRDISEGAQGITVSDIPMQTYKGKPVMPKIALYAAVGGKRITLKKNQYKITYTDNNAPGTAKATINGIGSFSGSRTLQFEIQ